MEALKWEVLYDTPQAIKMVSQKWSLQPSVLSFFNSANMAGKRGAEIEHSVL